MMLTDHIADGREVILNTLDRGPCDGGELINTHFTERTTITIEHLYSLTRNSRHAVEWRQAFGKSTKSDDNPSPQPAEPSHSEPADCVLEIARRIVFDFANAVRKPQRQAQSELGDGRGARNTVLCAIRILANCCVDNDENRGLMLDRDAVLPLLDLAATCFEPDVIVPTIYNICIDCHRSATYSKSGFDTGSTLATRASRDFSQGADAISPDVRHEDNERLITFAEQQLSNSGLRSHNNASAVLTLLTAKFVQGCSDDIREYLAELIEMATRSATVDIRYITRDKEQTDASVSRLLSQESGLLLAHESLTCRMHICQAVLNLCASWEAKTSLIPSIDRFAVLAFSSFEQSEDEDEDDDERQENQKLLDALRVQCLKLIYELCQMPTFVELANPGTARRALAVLDTETTTLTDKYLTASVMVILYGFANHDLKALMLVREGVLPPLIQNVQSEDKTLAYPAIALATKLAVTWQVRRKMVSAGIFDALRYPLTSAGLGYEVPLKAINLLEFLVKGHKEHIQMLTDRNSTSKGAQTVLQQVTSLYQRGNEEINLAIGCLFLEMCSTLMSDVNPESDRIESLDLRSFLQAPVNEDWATILRFLSKKAPQVVQTRVWFVMGALSTIEAGRQIGLKVMDSEAFEEDFQIVIGQDHGSNPVRENVKFTLHHLLLDEDKLPADVCGKLVSMAKTVGIR